MKNKLRYVLLGILVSFSFINTVFADEFVISPVVDNTTVMKGSEASIRINLKSSVAIKECLFKFENDSTLESVSIAKVVNNWVTNEQGVNGVSFSNSAWDTDVSDEGQNIAELKYKVNDSGNVIIKTVQCVSTLDEISYTYDDVVVSFIAQESEDDSTLSSLVVSNGQLSQTFSPTVTEYSIVLTSPNFGLSMVANNESYQDKIVVTDVNGNVITNPSDITFTDPSGQGIMMLYVTVNSKTKYTLWVSYAQKELDNSLSSITINGEELTLIDGKLSYKYTVDKEVTQIAVNAVLKDSENFKFGNDGNAPANGEAAKFNINDVVSVVIVVEPKDGISFEQKTYTIEIVKDGVIVDNKDNNDNETDNNGNNNGNVNNNPVTSDISMFVMAFILMVSLIGSIVLYQKNLESYK